MDERRVASLVVLAGGVGLVVGRVLFEFRFPRKDLWTVWAGHVWLTVVLGLMLVGVAGWHVRRFGVGTPVTIGLLAVVTLLFTLNDFFDPDPFWSGAYSAVGSVGAWLVVVSTLVVLIGLLWSAGQHVASGPTAAWRMMTFASDGID